MGATAGLTAGMAATILIGLGAVCIVVGVVGFLCGLVFRRRRKPDESDTGQS